MVSRKRNQGKARKAAKAKSKAAREEAEERRNNQATNTNRQQQSLAARMQQLQIGNALMSQNGVVKCRHGFEKMDDICTNFVNTFEVENSDAIRGGDRTFLGCLIRAEKATLDEYSDVWDDSAKMELAVSHFLSCGAQSILGGYNIMARVFASIARYFEQHIAVELHKTQALINFPKIHQAYEADEHTLVKFFRTRIPCSCLDEKYKEVKHITKMGVCYNPQCSLPAGEVERIETMYCSRCRCVTYCSRQCQKADWLSHKNLCDDYAAILAEFEAQQLGTSF
jgi:hypothetical protein